MGVDAGTQRGVRVGETRHGRGVFATRRFAAGETVEVCPTLAVDDANVTGLLSDYVFGSDDEDKVVLVLGYGMLYNHSAEANTEYVEDGPATIAFVTLRDVEAGEELTIDYGSDWWGTRSLTPD
jgi:hypothetical protein